MYHVSDINHGHQGAIVYVALLTFTKLNGTSRKGFKILRRDARSMPSHQQRQMVAILGDLRVAASEREWLEQRLTGMAVPRAVDHVIA